MDVSGNVQLSSAQVIWLYLTDIVKNVLHQDLELICLQLREFVYVELLVDLDMRYNTHIYLTREAILKAKESASSSKECS